MREINNYINTLVKIENQLPEIIEDIILKNQGKILSLIKQRVWNFGIDADGNLIIPSYKDITIEIKKFEGKRSSHVTLRDTGNFWKGVYLFVEENMLFVDSKDPKTPSLIEKYGESILGLTIQEQNILIYEIIEPEIQKRLNQLPDFDILTS